MKKIYLCAVAAVMMAACSNFVEQDAAPVIEVDAPATIYASFEVPADESRTYVEQGKYLKWSAGDEISFFPGVTHNMQYRFKGNTGDDNGSFEKVQLDPVTGADLGCNYALYPYSETTTISSAGKISVEMPAAQTYAGNSFGLGANTMVAATEDKDDTVLRFKNVGGYFVLKLYGENAKVKSITLTGNHNEKIAGAATITATYGGTPSVEMADTATTSVVTLDCSNGGEGVELGDDAENATEFWFVLPDVDFSEGLTIVVKGVDGGTFTKSTSNAISIDRNMIQPMAALKVVLGGEGIDIVNDKVRFYISEKPNSTRTSTSLTARDWATSQVVVNGETYDVQSPEENPYVEVAVAEDNVYNAALLTSGSSARYGTTPYDNVKLPYSQFVHTIEDVITSFPMYASYSAANKNKLIFNDGFALFQFKLKGSAKISSVKLDNLDNLAETTMAGVSTADATTGALTVDKGMNFAVLNCTNYGAFTPLSSSTDRNFYLMVAPGNYPHGLKLSICDSERGAMFKTIPAITLAAGQVYTINDTYACEEDLIFYEGFDNFVWGGDIVKGSTNGKGFAPDDTSVTYSNTLTRTGYEDAFTQVNYNIAGTSFIQPNGWDEVKYKTVAEACQLPNSYIQSRNIGEFYYLFRGQERPGYISLGYSSSADGMRARGIMYTHHVKCTEDINTVKVTMRMAFQENFTYDLQMQVQHTGVVQDLKVNGTAIDRSVSSLQHLNTVSSFTIPKSNLKIATSATAAKEWNTIEFVVNGATDGMRFHIQTSSANGGNHGIYIDSIEARVISNWQATNNLRVLLWNIQNGMIADQHNDYDNFVEWVQRYDPDICIWCESETIYKDMTHTTTSSKYLPDNWGEVAIRYGHSHAAVGGNRDNFPQTVTSKYPITTVKQITNTNVSGNPVSHGAGHFTIEVHGKKINIVTLHMWPHKYGFGVSGTANQTASAAAKEGDNYRQFEMQYIVNQTVKAYPDEEYWIFGGDTNSNSRKDDWYTGYSSSDPTRLITHDVVIYQTNLKDVIADRDCYGEANNVMMRSRIDVLYASPAMFDCIVNSTMLLDNWTSPNTDWEYYTSFKDPSDHMPVLVDFKL